MTNDMTGAKMSDGRGALRALISVLGCLFGIVFALSVREIRHQKPCQANAGEWARQLSPPEHQR